jgi:hypothetical protein
MATKSLNLTSIYPYVEQASDQSLTNTVMAYSLAKEGTIVVDYDMLDDAMHDITSRTSPFFAKYAIDKLVKSGKLQIVWNDTLRLTNAIPFFRKQEGGNKVSMVVNITNFSTMRQDGSINISSNTLYAMLLAAAFNLTMDDSIMTYVRDVYTMYARLFTNIVANLSFMDQIKKEKIQYLASNFFYYSVYGPSKTFTNPYIQTLRYNSKEAIVALDAKFQMYGDDSAYDNLKIFIENLNKVFPEMKSLTFKNFVDRWAASYGSSTLFASEYLPYFFYMIISTACLSPTVNVNKIAMEIQSTIVPVYKRIEKNVSDMAE